MKVWMKVLIIGLLMVIVSDCVKEESPEEPMFLSHPPVIYDESTNEVFIPHATIVASGFEYFERAPMEDTSLALVITADSNVYFYTPMLGNLDSLGLMESKRSLIEYLNRKIQQGEKQHTSVGIDTVNIGNYRYQFTNTTFRWTGVKETREGDKCLIRARELFNINFVNLIRARWGSVISIGTTDSDTLQAFPPDTFQLFGSVTRACFLLGVSGISQLLPFLTFDEMREAYQADPQFFALINMVDIIDVTFVAVEAVMGSGGIHLMEGALTNAALSAILSSTHSAISLAFSNSDNLNEFLEAIVNSVIRTILDGVIDALLSGGGRIYSALTDDTNTIHYGVKKLDGIEINGVSNQKEEIENATMVDPITVIKIISAVIAIVPVFIGGVQSTFLNGAYDSFVVGSDSTFYEFEEDFDDGLSRWVPFGYPAPQIVDVHGRTTVFDNNGDSWCYSGVISRETFDLYNVVSEMSADVYLQVDDYSGCWVEIRLGLTEGHLVNTGPCAGENYERWNVAGFRMIGDACWQSDPSLRRHSWISGHQTPLYLADQYVNGWHTLKVVIDSTGYFYIYLDGNHILTSSEPISPNFLTNAHLYLGDRSSGYGGKAYIDNFRLRIYRR